MNSRDAAYDEEEQLRRAIEASKEDASPDAQETVTTSVTRRTKRGRSESEEYVDFSRVFVDITLTDFQETRQHKEAENKIKITRPKRGRQ